MMLLLLLIQQFLLNNNTLNIRLIQYGRRYTYNTIVEDIHDYRINCLLLCFLLQFCCVRLCCAIYLKTNTIKRFYSVDLFVFIFIVIVIVAIVAVVLQLLLLLYLFTFTLVNSFLHSFLHSFNLRSFTIATKEVKLFLFAGGGKCSKISLCRYVYRY